MTNRKDLVDGMATLVTNEMTGTPTYDEQGRKFSHYDHEGWPVFEDPPKPFPIRKVIVFLCLALLAVDAVIYITLWMRFLK